MNTEPSTATIDLDHVTIVSDRVDDLRDFFRDVAGLVDGPRPPFTVDGHWMHANDRPVIHLIEATLAAGGGRVAPRIDHLALRVCGGQAWDELVERVRRSHRPYATSVVPVAGERQLFVELAPSVVVEFVTALAPSSFPNSLRETA